ncbi:adenylyl-sulfate kinase [Aequorivita marina]|uniref:adenylyl-sulfate kinase n=1 Tax=Aequorivita marina TaxID=3073654 RepID=UPI00287494D9|nr:adenylyl-sulfate kinase [Aequorivita sp. S2608]MDS1299066.1 adenylyl-sulfate kinase [Aequorivita sp. S2608]
MKEKLHIIPHDHVITQDDRNKLHGHQSKVIWFTGLSGSGKSTLASRLEQLLMEQGMHTYILDGDNVRSGLNKDLGFTEEDRYENLRRIAEVAKLMTDSGLIVLSAFVSPLNKDREMVRDIIGNNNFVEIYIATSLEECERRDVKGLYKKARSGEISNFTGLSAPYEPPENPDLVIRTENQNVAESATQVLKFLLEVQKINQL